MCYRCITEGWLWRLSVHEQTFGFILISRNLNDFFMARGHLYVHSNFKVWSFVNDCILFLFIFVWLMCVWNTWSWLFMHWSRAASRLSRLLSASVWAVIDFCDPARIRLRAVLPRPRLGWYAWVWKMQFTDVMLNISWYWISLRLLPHLYPRSEGYSFAALSRLKVCFCARSVFEGEELQFI